MVELGLVCRSPGFKGISCNEIESLLKKVVYQVKKFPKRSLIASFCDDCSSLMILLQGRCKGEMVDFSGKTIKIEDIDAPRPLAPAFLFGDNNKYPVDVVSETDVEFLIFPLESVLKMMQFNVVFLKNFLDQQANRAQFLSNKIRFLSLHNIKGKIAYFLLYVSRRKKSLNFEIPKTQTEIAELFGIARPSLSRDFRELCDSEILEVNGKNVKILNPEKLSNLLE